MKKHVLDQTAVLVGREPYQHSTGSRAVELAGKVSRIGQIDQIDQIDHDIDHLDPNLP